VLESKLEERLSIETENTIKVKSFYHTFKQHNDMVEQL